jgi:hypothetical protein
VKVRYRVGAAGPDKTALNPGDEVEVSAETGKELVEQGHAEPVAQKRRDRAEKRPSAKQAESR